MKIHSNMNLIEVMRKSGYGLIRGRQNPSFVRRLGTGSYPRFHAYADGNQINLHLDQKQPSYQGSHAHSGEYDGEIVETEAERIKQVMVNLQNPEIKQESVKKGFWSWLFDKNH